MLERAHAAADSRRQPLARQLAEVAAYRDLRDRKVFRKFRNRNVIPRLEPLQHLAHSLLLGKAVQVLVSGDDRATLRLCVP